MAISSLIAWCLFCTVTERSMPINQSTRDYFDVGDREELAYEEKLERYRDLADAHRRPMLCGVPRRCAPASRRG